ncbi:MAG: bifunctional helix-turn-helix domain-containing protein/methylated-DNA--[protein]-cysteine S-methyltransferase [Spirochaetales bacterium]|nr:bifunctional helix-turn-helix domain-containing protein/methylated-DNA--[protein]-cysteine S-methyltransferase [Spirochaetales bacterium]
MNKKDMRETAAQDYLVVERMIAFLETKTAKQPSLEELAASLGVPAFQLEELFNRWAGTSPEQFCRYLTREYARTLLSRSFRTIAPLYQLHELRITPNEIGRGDAPHQGTGIEIRYGFHPSPFGRCLLGITERGICSIRFLRPGLDESRLAEELRSRWPKAQIMFDPSPGEELLDRIFPSPVPLESASSAPGSLSLYVEGTRFQLQVWEALLRIPPGAAVSYESLAHSIGCSGGARAVGNAVGDNCIPFLIPCHRVLKKGGEFGNYGEGPLRKKAMLAREGAVWNRPGSGDNS